MKYRVVFYEVYENTVYVEAGSIKEAGQIARNRRDDVDIEYIRDLCEPYIEEEE